MSKVEELIKEICPKGVKYKTISDVCHIIAGGDAPKNHMSNEKTKQYNVPIYSNGIGNNALYGYTDEAKIFDKAVTISARGTIGWVALRTVPFYPIVRLICAYPKNKEELSAEYLYFLIQTLTFHVPDGGIPQLTVPMIGKKEIPIPPMKIQKEIVYILDKFTELEAKLQDELDARKKQYEYYRDRLFVFKNNIERKNILNVISMKARVGWQALTKKEYLTTGDYYLITGTDFREDGCIEFDSCVYVSEERYDMDDNIKVHVNDILMTKDGTLGKVAFMEQEPPKSATLNGGVYRLTVKTEDVLPKYVYHYFTSYEFKCFIEKVKTGGTIKHLTQKWFETLEVPVPPIKKQEEIVRILDTFSALCNSRILGLPAEIAARHKQYEYYRDKLLTFKRKEV